MAKDSESAYFEPYKVMSSAQITKFWECIDNAMRGTCSKTKDTTQTNCPNCGAVIDIHADKCAYCDTPYTFAMANDDTSTVKLYADNIVMCEMQMDVNRKLIDSMKTQRGLL